MHSSLSIICLGKYKQQYKNILLILACAVLGHALGRFYIVFVNECTAKNTALVNAGNM